MGKLVEKQSQGTFKLEEGNCQSLRMKLGWDQERAVRAHAGFCGGIEPLRTPPDMQLMPD